uniref:Uncharacterized protein n=1 Tax=Glossina austeni TaxID=7395 RepID=A0A1A9V5Y8_GLOAU
MEKRTTLTSALVLSVTSITNSTGLSKHSSPTNLFKIFRSTVAPRLSMLDKKQYSRPSSINCLSKSELRKVSPPERENVSRSSSQLMMKIRNFLHNFRRYNLCEMYYHSSSHLEREVGINGYKYLPGVSLNEMSSGKAVMFSKNERTDNSSKGLKFAGDMFGEYSVIVSIELYVEGVRMASDVADLIVKAFSANAKEEIQESKKPETQFNKTATSNLGWSLITSKLTAGILRLVQFDVRKLGALAVNTLILVAQTIAKAVLFRTNSQPTTNSLNAQLPYDQNTTGDDNKQNDDQFYSNYEQNLFDRLMKNPTKKLKQLLSDAADMSMADRLIHMIGDHEEVNDEGACLKLLICKVTPFIWNMQKRFAIYSMSDKEKLEQEKKIINESTKILNVESLFTHLPNSAEYQEQSRTCEQRYLFSCNKKV